MPTEILTPTYLGGLPVRSVSEPQDWYNWFIYGESSVGKTTLAGSACMVPEMAPVIHLDFEGGAMSLAGPYPQVDTIRVTGFQQGNAIYNDLANGSHPYRTVIIDSGTEAQDYAMRSNMDEVLIAHPDRDLDIPSKREYGKVLNQMRRFMKYFRDLPMHTIFVGLAGTREDDNGIMITQPAFSGKFGYEGPAIPDMVLYYYMKNVQLEGEEAASDHRLLLTKRTSTIVAKSRQTLNPMPDVIIDPTMQDLFDYMRGGFVDKPQVVKEQEAGEAITDDPTIKESLAEAIPTEQVMLETKNENLPETENTQNKQTNLLI